mmetsp:Transcript_15617/g.44446  ORF Transcript_15617/g.44446 Transcript_15617/m.44446 type:complete len:268 (-) Transcript_15617:146-949(-)
MRLLWLDLCPAPRVQSATERTSPILQDPLVEARRVEYVPARQPGDRLGGFEILQADHATRCRCSAKLPVPAHLDRPRLVQLEDRVALRQVGRFAPRLPTLCPEIPPQGPVQHRQEGRKTQDHRRGIALRGSGRRELRRPVRGLAVARHEEEHYRMPHHEDATKASQHRRRPRPASPRVQAVHAADRCAHVPAVHPAIGQKQPQAPTQLHPRTCNGQGKQSHVQPVRHQELGRQIDLEPHHQQLHNAPDDIDGQAPQQQRFGLPTREL